MLEGIKIMDIKKLPDERGNFAEIMRNDWNEFLEGHLPVQSNLAMSYPGVVKAWHRHERGQVDYYIIVKGSVKVCAFDEASGELDEIVVSGERLQIIRMPGNYWHGLKMIGNEPVVMIYFVTKLYDYSSPDELRRSWDDKTIVPKNINGKTYDPRIGKPWDWNANINK